MQTFPTTWRLFQTACAVDPSATAVVEGGQRWTYGELFERVQRRIAGLSAAGIGQGDRVAILDRNGLDFLELTFAVGGLSAVLVPLNTRWSRAEIEFVSKDADVRLLLYGRSFESLARSIEGEHELRLAAHLGGGDRAPAPADDPDGLAFLYYTSGTTGPPKGVMLTHANVCVHAAWAVEVLKLGREDVWAHVAPMFHLADAWATLAVTQVRGLHTMVPRFDARLVLEVMAREHVTMTNLVPTMLNRIVAEGSDLEFPRLRRILSGGAPISPELVRRIVRFFGCEYVQTYGMTETSPFLTMSQLGGELMRLSGEERMRLRSRTGRPFAGVSLEVVGSDDQPVPTDDATVGEIRVKGPSVSTGYWNRPEATNAAFRDGWLYTGDLAVIDSFGFVNIVDRKKDMIITGGESVYSTEVEHVLAAHEAVVEVAVYGRPDSDWGEVVCAAVALVPGQSIEAEELIAHCKTRLAGYKAPRSIEFLPELPKTGSGKIAKRILRDGAGT